MDGLRFDQLTRDAAGGSSRRSLIKTLGGGVLTAHGAARTRISVGADFCPRRPARSATKGAQWVPPPAHL